jgi:hypothetical protein
LQSEDAQFVTMCYLPEGITAQSVAVKQDSAKPQFLHNNALTKDPRIMNPWVHSRTNATRISHCASKGRTDGDSL